MFKILVTDPLAEEGLAIMRDSASVDVSIGIKPEELIEKIPDYDALVVRSETQVTKDVIDAGRKLKVVGRAGVGVNNIDVKAATVRGVVVVNVPGGNTIAATEQTFALLLALARHVPEADQTLRSGVWDRKRFTGIELYGKTMGVIGLGRIGVEVSRRAKAFGMKVVGYDPYISRDRAEEVGVELKPLEEVLKEADFLTIHTPLTQDTRKLIGEREIAMMKDGAFIVNCARGGIVEESVLLNALKSGKLGGAALDVFEKEPPGENELFKLKNVVVTPHLGASTAEAQVTNSVEIARMVLKVLEGEPVMSAVNLPPLATGEWEAISKYMPLAELVGSFYGQALAGRLGQIEVRYMGEVASYSTALLTNVVLKGLLGAILDEDVNFVNASYLAEERGVKVVESKSSADRRSYPSLIAVVGSDNGGRTSVTGAFSFGGESRIVEINGYPLDMAPSPHMLFIPHYDKPGIIGRVGSVLGSHDINIAGMQVGRKEKGGLAVMLMQVDLEPADDVVSRIAEVPGVNDCKKVGIAEGLLPGGPGGFADSSCKAV